MGPFESRFDGGDSDSHSHSRATEVLQQACGDVLQNAPGNGPAISAAIRGRAPSAYFVGLLSNRSATCLLYHLALPVVLCPAVWSLAGMR